ncbi:NnrU family protein [Arenibaculum pallidiluteum]|uniref:NnrU family protein n=1 Tax=Arenibaculum pallidiluteum TaxID=2812559 RepID=UPI001A95E08F|nr:NnrU family protein [Arenibaculum pallidiluteum]
MIELSAALVLLVASHVIPSRPGLRERLLAALGRPAFVAVYSAISVLALAAVIVAYGQADPTLLVWSPPFEGRYVAFAAMPLAMVLLVCRLTQGPGAAPHGIYRVTTTPGSLAVLVWSLVHLLNVGAARTILVFLGMLAIALWALLRNAARATPPGPYGVLPFARIAAGRERLAFSEIGWWRLLAALVLTAVLLLLHPVVIGVDPLAGVL